MELESDCSIRVFLVQMYYMFLTLDILIELWCGLRLFKIHFTKH